MLEWGYNADEKAGFDALEPALPGDIWRLSWHRNEGEGPTAGYAICCPLCKQLHYWTTATNCGTQYETSYTDSKGVAHKSMTCTHSGEGSCWNWTGSAEEGTLSASPSLHCVKDLGGCGWHGWLQDGVMRG